MNTMIFDCLNCVNSPLHHMRPKLLSPLVFPMRDMVARYIAVVIFDKKTIEYPYASNDKSRDPATNAPNTIKATLIKP